MQWVEGAVEPKNRRFTLVWVVGDEYQPGGADSEAHAASISGERGAYPAPSMLTLGSTSSPCAVKGGVIQQMKVLSWELATHPASAVLDRLVHHAHLVPIVGESFRMKDHNTRQKGETAAEK